MIAMMWKEFHIRIEIGKKKKNTYWDLEPWLITVFSRG